ncbi:hypothetical protein Tco_0488592 [Tanacetum coccineum]
MMQTGRGDGVTSIKRFRRDLSSDGVEDLTTVSRHLATWAIGTILSSPKGTMWYLFYPKPSGWCKRMLIQDFVSEDPNINQGFLKLVGSLDFDVAKGKEHSGFFSIFPLAYQASNGLNVFSRIHLNMGGFLPRVGPCSFFLRERTAKLHNDILMVQQHQGECLFEAWTRFKDLLQKVPHHGIDLWLQL